MEPLKEGIVRSYYEGPSKSKRSHDNISTVAGLAIGAGGAGLLQSTGVHTGLHEVFGHEVMGYGTTYRQGDEGRPTTQVDGWDNLKAIKHEGFKGFWRWLTGYDRNGDGASGRCRFQEGKPTGFGENMGDRGRSAWISIWGSIPGLMLNTTAVVGGLSMRKNHKAAGTALFSYGLTSHIFSSFYPCSAAAMSNRELGVAAKEGHDFANFSVQMGHMTDSSPRDVAIGTAIAWTAFLPVVALGVYLHQKTHETDIVPDHIGLQQWLADHPEQLYDYLEKYPEKQRLERPHEMTRFVEYLLKTIPKKELKTSKQEVLRQWKLEQKRGKFEKAIHTAHIVSIVAIAILYAFQILKETVVPSLAKASAVMMQIAPYLSPVMVGLSLASRSFQLMRDLKADSIQVPKKAKVLSVINVVVGVAATAVIVAGLFCPGLHGLVILGIAVNVIGSIVFGYARHKVIEKRFKALHAKDEDTFNFMYKMLELYEDDHGNIDINWRTHGALYYWLKDIKITDRLGQLSNEQRQLLVKKQVLS